MGRPQGSPASESQRKAGRANLDKAHASSRAKNAKAKAAKERGDFVSAKDRWAMLLDGRLTVKELNDEELLRQRTADSTGRFPTGRPAGMTVPSHLAAKMQAEFVRRVRKELTEMVSDATQTLKDLMSDPEVAPQVRARIATDMVERLIGKTPDVVNVKVDDWAGVVGDAVEVERDLSDIEEFANEGK